MNICCYYFWNQTQVELRNVFELTMRHFMPKIILNPIEFVTETQNSAYGTQGFKQLMLEKANKVKQIIDNNKGKEIIISDIDIIIYNNFENELNLQDYEILLQKENSKNVCNTGFLFLRCSERLSLFWQKVIDNIAISDGFTNEQRQIITLLRSNYLNLKHGLFSDKIWAYSNQPIPDNILIYHANRAANVSNKKSQIKRVLQQNTHPLHSKILKLLSIDI